MTWVRLDDQFYDSPKMEGAGPLAAAIQVAALCYSARHLTDGVVPESKARRLLDIAQAPKHIRALVDAGAWHRPGHGCDRCAECPPGHFLIHDYLDYQPSREQVEADRAKERAKKQRQRRRGAANAGRDPASGRYAGLSPGDTGRDAPGDVARDGRRESPATRPDPTPTEELSSSDTPTPAEPRRDDDGPDSRSRPTPGTRPRRHAPLVVAAARVLAGRDRAAREAAVGPVQDPDAWEDSALRRRLDRDGDRLAGLARSHPDAEAEALADLITAGERRPAPPGGTSRAPNVDPDHQAAVRAEQERNMAAAYARADMPVDFDEQHGHLADIRQALRARTGAA